MKRLASFPSFLPFLHDRFSHLFTAISRKDIKNFNRLIIVIASFVIFYPFIKVVSLCKWFFLIRFEEEILIVYLELEFNVIYSYILYI